MGLHLEGGGGGELRGKLNLGGGKSQCSPLFIKHWSDPNNGISRKYCLVFQAAIPVQV